MGRSALLLILIAIGLVAYAVAIGRDDHDAGAEPVPIGANVDCDQILRSNGNVGAFLGRLDAGETGCLRGGTHTASDVAAVSEPRVTLTSYPGESATLIGRLWIEQGADGVVVENLTLDGRNPGSLPSPTVNADKTVFSGNDISNGNTAICFVIGSSRFGTADGTLIEGNRIHDCGRLPPTNRQHGIYVSHATDTVIRRNWIYDNADRGVQLYPDADRTLVSGNVITGNGEGVLLGGDSDEASDGNLIVGNTIARSKIRYNVESHWESAIGLGNRVRYNCLWMARLAFSGQPRESGIEPSIDGADASDNVVAKPRYVDPLMGDLALEVESCSQTD